MLCFTFFLMARGFYYILCLSLAMSWVDVLSSMIVAFPEHTFLLFCKKHLSFLVGLMLLRPSCWSHMYIPRDGSLFHWLFINFILRTIR